jgi:hypothetical protein
VAGKIIIFVGFAFEIWKLPCTCSSNAPSPARIWEHVAIWSNCGNLHPVQWGEAMDLEDWFFTMVEPGSKKAHTLAILTLWCIWSQRNAAVFNNKTSTAAQVFAPIKDESFLWASAGAKVLRPLPVENNFGVIS